MKQYIMLGIIAAGIIILAVFLFASMKKKGDKSKPVLQESVFPYIKKNNMEFPEDYRTEILEAEDKEFGGGYEESSGEEFNERSEIIREETDSAERPEYGDVTEKRAEAITVGNECCIGESCKKNSEADWFEKSVEKTDGYSILNCNIKSLTIDENFLEKITMNFCSIENICIVTADKKRGEVEI